MEIVLATIALGMIAKFIEVKLENSTNEWNDLETLNVEVVKQKVYSNLESY
jgi:hypothetical protein